MMMLAQSRNGMRNVYAVRENGYRFAFNGQEKTDEISGFGNHNTALYGSMIRDWEEVED